MPQKVDQKFYNQAVTKCSNCGSIYVFGASQESMSIEICGYCHPFYSGKETVVDTAGRIEKFMARQSKLASPTNINKKLKARKNKQFLGDIPETPVLDQPKVENKN